MWTRDRPHLRSLKARRPAAAMYMCGRTGRRITSLAGLAWCMKWALQPIKAGPHSCQAAKQLTAYMSPAAAMWDAAQGCTVGRTQAPQAQQPLASPTCMRTSWLQKTHAVAVAGACIGCPKYQSHCCRLSRRPSRRARAAHRQRRRQRCRYKSLRGCQRPYCCLHSCGCSLASCAAAGMRLGFASPSSSLSSSSSSSSSSCEEAANVHTRISRMHSCKRGGRQRSARPTRQGRAGRGGVATTRCKHMLRWAAIVARYCAAKDARARWAHCTQAHMATRVL